MFDISPLQFNHSMNNKNSKNDIVIHRSEHINTVNNNTLSKKDKALSLRLKSSIKNEDVISESPSGARLMIKLGTKKNLNSEKKKLSKTNYSNLYQSGR